MALLLIGCLLVGCPKSGYDRQDSAVSPAQCQVESAYSGAVPFAEDPSTIDATMLPQAAAPCHAPVLAHVERNADGDTIHITYTDPNNGQPAVIEEQIRIIGVNSPEIAHAPTERDECFGQEASRFTNQLVGHFVWLTFDRDCRDPYDRWLAYVHTTDAEGGFFNRQLMQRGFARALSIAPNTSFQATFAEDQSRSTCALQGLHIGCRLASDAGSQRDR